MISLFIILYIFAVYSDIKDIPLINRKYLNMLIFLSIAVMVGLRTPELWGDTPIYVTAFDSYTNTLQNWSLNDFPYGYSERGFLFLSSVIKTFTESSTIYLLIISLITFFLLYKFTNKYSIYPLIGLCIYMARFLTGRNMLQIRAALAIAIVILATKYITEQKLWKFLLIIMIAYLFHHSAIIALPLYFINKISITRNHIFFGLAIAFLIAGFWGGFIRDIISNSDYINELATSYVQEDSDKAWSNSLANPMIYYQSAILILFTLNESKLSKISKHYYTYRNAYFYSTLLLIILCQYAIVAGRTSTIFATYEMVMIPLFIKQLERNNKALAILLIGILYGIFFYLNWNPVISNIDYNII